MPLTDLKVELEWHEYAERGLRVEADLIGDADVVAVFDKNLDFTRHEVVSIEGNKAVLGPATPWPGRPRGDAG